MKYFIFLILLAQSSIILANGLRDRLASFATINSSNAQFVETWSATYLNEPLVSKGQLKYIRPSKLSKLISSPEHIEQRIEGNQLSIEYNDEIHVIQLTEQPDLAIGIYALQAVLDGDKDRLYQLFKLEYTENMTTWGLLLVPKDKSLANTLESIKIEGVNNHILRVQTQFYNGDSLLTEILSEK